MKLGSRPAAIMDCFVVESSAQCLTKTRHSLHLTVEKCIAIYSTASLSSESILEVCDYRVSAARQPHITRHHWH